MNARAVYHLARADFLERVRRYSFFVTVLFAAFLGYATATGRIALHLGKYRGVYTSAWIGMNMALVATCFLSLVGFYIVKNAIDRDRATRVGEILASTPLNRSGYLLGKWLSNTAVLSAQVLMLAVSSVVMQFVIAEDPHVDLWALLAPFLLLALPAMAFTGAVAVLFESMPVLRGGIGNVVWFFTWATGIAIAGLTDFEWLDFTGIVAAMKSISRAARAAIPGYNGEFEFQISSPQHTVVAGNLRWHGLQWDLPLLAMRLEWLGVALALVLLATLFFDRFDPARRRSPSGVRGKKVAEAASTAPESAGATARAFQKLSEVHLTPLSNVRNWGIGRMLAAELRLALKGQPWWWFAVAAGLLVAECAAPLAISRGPLLTAAWIWPILVWSAMGAREARHGTAQLVFSAPRALRRQIPAAWLAGVLIAVASGGGAAFRILLARDYPALLGWFAGALFVPSLALALGVWSKSSRAFEGSFTALWYIGPLNHVRGFDFTGAANGRFTAWYACVYVLIAAALFSAALFARARQLQTA